MYKMYLHQVGEVILHLDTMVIDGFMKYITGYDCDRNRIDFVIDRLSHDDEYPMGYGFCRVVSYTIDGTTMSCNKYYSLS